MRSYLRSVQEFARYFNRAPHQLRLEQVRQYTAYLFETRQLSSSSVRQQLATLRFFYVNTFRRGGLSKTPPIRTENTACL